MKVSWIETVYGNEIVVLLNRFITEVAGSNIVVLELLGGF